MAQTPIEQSAYFNLPMSVNRLNPVPIDPTMYWSSYEDALAYAQSNPVAHIGQFLAVHDTAKNDVTAYLIDVDGSLKEIGSVGGALVVDTLPSTSDTSLKTGSFVYLTTNNKLYYLKEVTTGEPPETTKTWVQIIEPDDLSDLGAGDMLKATYDTDNDGVVDAAEVAHRTQANINFLDVNGTTTKTFNGGLEVNISAGDLGALTSVPLATDSVVGGIRSSTAQDSASVTSNGTLSINQLSGSKIVGNVASANVAGRVSNSLTIGDSEYDGSVAVSITAANLGALTEVPPATASNIGGVIVGGGLDVDANGTLSVNYTQIPKATTTNAGVVVIGSGLAVDANGVLSANQYTLPTASQTVKGGVKIDGTTIVKTSDPEQIAVGTIQGTQVNGPVEQANNASVAANYSTGDGGNASIAQALASKQNAGSLANDVKAALSGQVGGFAPLNDQTQIPSQYLPSYVDDIIEGTYVNETTFQVDGSDGPVTITLETGKIYIDKTTNTQYRYTGSVLVSISNPIDFATKEEAMAMTSEVKVMSPARTKDAIQAANISVAQLFVADGDTLILNCGNSVITTV